MISILVVNVGSTSLKFKLIDFPPGEARTPAGTRAEGRIEGIGAARSPYKITAAGKTREGEAALPGYEDALKLLVDSLNDGPGGKSAGGLGGISAICFKPVHARDVPREIAEMNEDVLGRMEEFNAVAPAHNPPVIAAVRSFRAMAPEIPLLGLFEPAFYGELEPKVYMESVPAGWAEEFGIRKYGFHGASHRFIAERTPEFLGVPAAGLRFVSCHLGGSSSITAIRGGKAVETTMSFSPQSGLPQGTRCGSIDPFIPIFLMQSHGWTLERTAKALGKESGLLGLSGVSAEFREIDAAAKQGNAAAARAIEVFTYQVQCEIARMTVALGGLDAVVFTGGIGERGEAFRAAVCKGLAHLGVEIDDAKNAAAIGAEASIGAANARVKTLVIPTNEELVLAREAAGWLTGRAR